MEYLCIVYNTQYRYKYETTETFRNGNKYKRQQQQHKKHNVDEYYNNNNKNKNDYE